MTSIEIVPTSKEHLLELRETIRDSDRREIEDLGISCEDGILRSFKNSLTNKTLLVDRRVAAVFGCGGTFIGEFGRPWLLTSHEMKNISPLKFVRLYKKEMYEMLEMFPVLENFCSASYTQSLKLLEMCGFTISEPQEIGTGLFCRFSRGR